MLFNSITFIIFFIYALMVHYSGLSWQHKKSHLLFCSYLFYAAWNPPFVLLLLLSTVVDWHLAKKMYHIKEPKKRKQWLWLSLLFNLSLLSFFKYSTFLLENFHDLLQLLSIDLKLPESNIILPMGISFYTFQTLSYTIDVYHKKLKPHHSFKDYALFVSFFPQLVAGPIIRAKHFLPQLNQQNTIGFATFSLGLSLFIIGLFEKTVLADALFAPLVDQVFATQAEPNATSAWLGAVFFYGQIFCDFSGYSLCAIGTAMCLGFHFPFNFQSPFSAIGFSDFWRRWHISLSSWLRDYLYIPLGGNRYGKFNTLRNLMITMLLGGLWHGAAWTFILWGLIHGLYLMVERSLKNLPFSIMLAKLRSVNIVMMFITFLLIMLSFVVFRAESISQIHNMMNVMFTGNGGTHIIAWNLWTQFVMVAFVLLFLIQWVFKNRTITEVLANTPVIFRGIFLATCLILIIIASGNSNAFIYFQF